MKWYRFFPKSMGLITDWSSDEIGLYYQPRLGEILKLLEVGERYANSNGTWERIE